LRQAGSLALAPVVRCVPGREEEVADTATDA
jgi:hypothetical protein